MAEIKFTADIDINILQAKLKKIDDNFTNVARDAAQAGSVIDKIFKQAATNSIDGMTMKLNELQKTFNSLSAADRVKIGEGISREIGELSTKIEFAKNQFTALESGAAGSIDSMVAKMAELQRQFNALSASDRVAIGGEYQKEIQSLIKGIEEAKGQFISMENVAEDSINGMINKLIDLNKQYNNLSANDRATIGEGLQKQMANLNADIEKAKKQFVSLSVVSEDSIEGMTQKLMELNKQYKALSASDRDTIGAKLAQDMAALSGEIDKANLKMRASAGGADAYTKSMYGLNFSIQQVLRETPNLAISPQLYIMAISNNLPIMADEISRIIKLNAELRAANQATIPVWKQVGSAIFSWQSALLLGVTALTMNGDKIGPWISSLFKAENAINILKKTQENFNAVTLKGEQNAQEEATKLQLLYSAATNSAKSLEERNKAVDELQKLYPDYLGNIDDEVIKTGNAAGAYENLKIKIIEAAKARAYADQIAANSKKILQEEEELFKNQTGLEKASERLQNARDYKPSSFSGNQLGGVRADLGAAEAEYNKFSKAVKNSQDNIAQLALENQKLSENINISDYLYSNKSKEQGEKLKAAIGDVKGEYQQLEDSIRKVSDAVLNASEKERPALQEKLNLLVQQKQAMDDLIKSQRGETTGLKPLTVAAKVSGDEKESPVELAPMKQLTDEQRKQLEAKAKQVSIEEKIAEKEKERNELLQGITELLDQTIQKYGDMLGLSTDQQEVLKNSANAMKGMAQIVSGNVIQGSLTLLASTVDMLVKAPEKMSVHYENVQKQVDKIISSLQTASEAMNNIGKNSSFSSLQVIKSQILGLADDAKKLNVELAKSSTGRRRDTNTSLPTLDMVKQAADLNSEIEKLTTRLLRGDISDDQRKAIEDILKTYNTLIQQFNSTIQDLIGTTVSDFGMALSDAILAGADAWDVWEEKATDVIRRVTSKQLYSKLIEKPITDAVNNLVNDSADSLSPDESKKFTDTVKGIYESVGPAYQAAIDALKAAGIDLTKASSTSSATGIAAGATEDTVAAMVGQLMALRVDTSKINGNVATLLNFSQNQLLLMDQQLGLLNQIAKNTSHNAELPGIKAELQNVAKILNDKLS